MNASPLALALAASLALAACESSPSLPPDGGRGGDAETRADAGEDAGVVRDGGAADAGARDEGVPDAGARDEGVTDVGASDEGVGDEGVSDLGAHDAGPDLCVDPLPIASAPPAPPSSGTAFWDPDIVTASDPSSFVDLTYAGTGSRTMFDRRVNNWVTLDAHLFDAIFGADTRVEIQVNPEMNRTQAETEARRYALVIGRLPAFLFRDLETVWIHRGMNAFGGGNRNLLIHTDQGESYDAQGYLEEIFMHEAAHTSMDAYHASAARWLEAQSADGTFISTYARDNPTREDVAESLLVYVALRFRSDRISDAATIADAIPARVIYFDCLDLSMDVLAGAGSSG